MADIEFSWNRPPRDIVDDKTKRQQGLLWLGNEFRKHMTPHVPRKNGALSQNVQVVAGRDDVTIIYKSPYAHYQYEGVLFVDPLYGVGGFTNGEGLFWSRPDVAKRPSGRALRHNTGQSKWDEPIRGTELPAIVAAFQRFIGGI